LAADTNDLAGVGDQIVPSPRYLIAATLRITSTTSRYRGASWP
jgi:hypothetical protein